MDFALGLLAGIIATAGAGGLFVTVRRYKRRIEQLEAKLAEVKTKRLPYDLMEMIDNALAAQDADIEQKEIELEIARNAHAWMTRARNYRGKE